VLAVVAGVALVALACGSSSKNTATGADGTTSTTAASTSGGAYGVGASPTTTSAPEAPAGTETSLSVAATSLGDVVVDAEGFTLYLFEKDTGTTSTCVDACAAAWPPATVTGTPTASSDITGAVTTTTRPDGSTQIVLAGHPLYRFASDTAPGDVMGQGVAGSWYAVSPGGEAVE
jgi:predicted lipoprotein with Yx(FWY)xxD motif